MNEIVFPAETVFISTSTAALRGLWNFIVFQVKFNIFLHPYEHVQSICWYFVKWFDLTPQKLEIIEDPTFSILEPMNRSIGEF